jgi:tetratricopeptide (TPR) repeat protein
MPLPESAVVEEVCANTVRGRTRTNRQGDFSLALGQASNAELMTNTDASDNGRSFEDKRLRLAGCELRAVLPGYISTMTPLSASDTEIGMKNVGTLVLKKIGGAPAVGPTISATSFKVPDDARKEYEKAEKEAQKNKFKQAQEHLQKAVDIYPAYAEAWVGLGKLHEHDGRIDESKSAFQRAMDADANYVPPYLHLALYAAREKRWEDARALTDKALRLDPKDYADAYFINAIANFNLHHLQEAQKAALKAAEMDREHRQPRIHYLLAAICEANGDREQAAMHLKEYLQFAPEAPDASAAKAHLAELSNAISAQKD